MSKLHQVGEISGLQKELQKRIEALLQAMGGTAPTAADERLYAELDPHQLGTHRWVNGQKVVLASDDISTVLREIKRTLGK